MPLPPVTHLERPSTTATSSSTTAEPPALPHSEPRATPRERRRTLPEPSKQPRSWPIRPSSPQNPQMQAVSPPPVSHTPAVLLTMLPTPIEAPCSLPVPLSLPIPPSSPQLGPRRAVSPSPPSFTTAVVSEPSAAAVLHAPSLVKTPSSPVPPCSTRDPTCLDWAEDAASMPAPPAMYPPPWDLSTLRTGRIQPFGTLQRRTPLNFFSTSRVPFPPDLPSFAQPQPFISQCHPYGIGPGKPVITVPFGMPAPAPPIPVLNWDCVPHLADLSQALQIGRAHV